MPVLSNQSTHPRERAEAECERRGRTAFISGCMKLLSGGEADGELIFALGGGPARWAVQGGKAGPDYWLRVWAARGLLYVWDDRAVPVILGALGDPSWRVREMAVRVAAKHTLERAARAVADMHDDPNARVRAAADRATGSRRL